MSVIHVKSRKKPRDKARSRTAKPATPKGIPVVVAARGMYPMFGYTRNPAAMPLILTNVIFLPRGGPFNDESLLMGPKHDKEPSVLPGMLIRATELHIIECTEAVVRAWTTKFDPEIEKAAALVVIESLGHDEKILAACRDYFLKYPAKPGEPLTSPTDIRVQQMLKGAENRIENRAAAAKSLQQVASSDDVPLLEEMPVDRPRSRPGRR